MKELKPPITPDDITADPVLASWWRSRPWRGWPKRIPEKVARQLLGLIAELNPRLAPLLRKYQPAPSVRSIALPDDDDAPPPTVAYTFSHRVRNPTKGEKLKRLYGCKCQVCRYRIRVPGAGGGWYAEVHHLRPLGGDHQGGDTWRNMLVLYPTCHAEFDALAMAVDPETGRVVCFDRRNPKGGRKFACPRPPISPRQAPP